MLKFFGMTGKFKKEGGLKTLRRLLVLGSAVVLLAATLSSTPQWKTLKNADDLPETICSTWEKGDLLITFGRHMAIFGVAARPMYSVLNYPIGDGKGCLLSLAPAGQGIQSDICMGSPYLTLKAKARPVFYSEVTPLTAGSGGPNRIRAAGFYRAEGGIEAQVATVYRLVAGSGGQIDITSTLTNSGSLPIENFRYSLYMGAGTRYNYSPFDRKAHPDLNFIVYPRPDHTLVRWNRNPVTGERKDVLQPGESFEIRYSVFAETDTQALLERLYREAGHRSFPTSLKLIGYKGGLYEVIIREEASGSVFFRDFVKDRDALSIPLIAGSYTAQVSFFPASEQMPFRVGAGEDNSVIMREPHTGTVHVQIQDQRGRHVPGKVTFIGLQPTRSPYFEPENPIQTGRGWENFKNSRFPGAEGTDVTLPAGTYMVHASRGPEYTIDHKILEVFKDENTALSFHIDHVLDTKGLISIDPHLHTMNSDGSMGIPERIRSLVAEGLDVAVATDHNYVNNYGPELESLGYEDILAVICGNEITVGGMVHYNTFPLQYRPDESLNGAIDPVSDSMAELFRRSRSNDPDILIQVNHPRSGNIGYFNMYALDPEKAAYALEGFETDFDVLEVLNGPSYHSTNVESIRDWFHLLNRGYTIPLIGSSDAHSIDRGEPGYSRTYVAYKGKKGTGLDVPAVISALKEGRSFASNGPLVDVKVNRKYTFGDTFTDKDGTVSVSVRVRRAPWVSLEEVRFIINGERDVILPIEGKNAERSDFTFKEKVTLTQDAYIVVEVIGKQGLYPVLQRASQSGLKEHATLPYALTNPVYIDVDGNGRFDPPWEHKIELLSEIPKVEKKE
jgi:hypothetical protein